MTKGMPKIQKHPKSTVKFILGDHIPFQLHAPADHFFSGKVQSGLRQQSKQLRGEENGIFDNLGTAVPEDILRQCMQGVDVAQNKDRLAEGTGKILSGR